MAVVAPVASIITPRITAVVAGEDRSNRHPFRQYYESPSISGIYRPDGPSQAFQRRD
jgi:hypothetical protein